MLTHLSIKNFAIIEEVALDFKAGMTVFTGETGAGKSIIIDAVGLLAGGRGSSEFVRYGCKKCALEGHFKLTPQENLKELLAEKAIDCEDDVLIIQRDIYQTGRSVCRVNGSILTISDLKEISRFLIDIHGQSEHQELMNDENHLALLDQFGQDKIKKLLADYQLTYDHFKKLRKQYKDWQKNEQEYAQRVDMLSFQVQEIEKAKLEKNEDHLLEEEFKQLNNFQAIHDHLQEAYMAIQEEATGGLSQLGKAMEHLGEIESYASDYKNISETLSNLFFQVQELGSEVYHQLDLMEYDPNRLYEIEERLNLIYQLKRKYGESVEDILYYYQQAKKELTNLSGQGETIEDLAQELKTVRKTLIEKGEKLQAERVRLANTLEKEIHHQLKELYMEKVVFKVDFEEPTSEKPLGKANRNGLGSVKFLIATNPGEPLKPLAKVASGGELSRIMLAMKTIFSTSQAITSIIFDEVDTGVSGRVAQAIANKIYAVAVSSQVLCISHLPQVAAMADHHLYISKQVTHERTSTQVRLLEEEAKVEEVARMLAGEEITDLSLKTAQELRSISSDLKANY